MATYLDLNPVRAGIVDDPMLDEFSGYGDAAGGSKRARGGLCKAFGLPQNSWEGRALARNRLFPYDEGIDRTSLIAVVRDEIWKVDFDIQGHPKWVRMIAFQIKKR